MIYTSSNAFIGDVRGKHGHPDFVPLDESLPPNPADIYGVTKVCSETLGNYYRKRYGVNFVALRYPSIYGPGKLARHGVLALYGKIIEDAMAGREFSVPRGGDQRNDVVYVGDVARSVVLALEAEGAIEGTFNIGTGRGVTLKDFAAVLERMFPEARLDIGSGLDFREGYKQSYCIFDIGKARAATRLRTPVRPGARHRGLRRKHPAAGVCPSDGASAARTPAVPRYAERSSPPGSASCNASPGQHSTRRKRTSRHSYRHPVCAIVQAGEAIIGTVGLGVRDIRRLGA